MLGMVLAGEDFYDLLRIDRNADTAAIKKAFRKMSLEYHPDKNPGKQAACNSLITNKHFNLPTVVSLFSLSNRC